MRAAIAALLAAAGLVAACSSTPSKTDAAGTTTDGVLPPVELQLTAETYPLVDGSTSTHPLAVLLACELLGLPFKWEPHPFDGTQRIVPDPGADQAEVAQKIAQQVVHNGTHGAYVNLIQGNADLALVARPPSQDELDEAQSQQVTLQTRAIALDAFIFILNQQNPVASLATQQLQEIYTGATTRWDQVGGAAEEINPYQRDANSGSQELMESLVMKDLTMIDAPDMILMGMMGPINQISQDPLGIGYSVFFFEQFMAPNDQLKLCGVDGTVPSSATIGSRDYAFTTEVYAAIRADLDPRSNAYKLRDWLLTAAGQAVVQKSGYVQVY